MSRTRRPGPYNEQIRKVQRQIDDQRALLQRMIVQGGVTQSLEDVLRQLYLTLQQTREQQRGSKG
jgi:hypothetical protein